jgi:hypothetical protein
LADTDRVLVRRALKSRLYQIPQWQAIDGIYSVSEFRFKLWNWKNQRRFVVVREVVQTKKPAVGRKTAAVSSLPGQVLGPKSRPGHGRQFSDPWGW